MVGESIVEQSMVAEDDHEPIGAPVAEAAAA